MRRQPAKTRSKCGDRFVHHRAFDMCVAQAPSTPAARPVWNDAVLSAVARTLAPTERGTLDDALGASAIRWEANVNPMLEDLEGGDPDAALIAWFKTAPSFVRTAQASTKLRTCAPDGCCASPRALGALCPAGSAAPNSADETDRARFLRWTWGPRRSRRCEGAGKRSAA